MSLDNNLKDMILTLSPLPLQNCTVRFLFLPNYIIEATPKSLGIKKLGLNILAIGLSNKKHSVSISKRDEMLAPCVPLA